MIYQISLIIIISIYFLLLWHYETVKSAHFLADNKAKTNVVLGFLDFSSEIEYGANKDIHDLVL